MLEPPSRPVPYGTTNPPWCCGGGAAPLLPGAPLNSKVPTASKDFACLVAVAAVVGDKFTNKKKTKNGGNGHLDKTITRHGNSQVKKVRGSRVRSATQGSVYLPNSALAATSRRKKQLCITLSRLWRIHPPTEREMCASIGSELLSVSPDFLSRSLLFHIFFSCAHTYLH